LGRSGLCILLAERNGETRRHIASALRREGHTVIEISTCGHLLESIAAHSPAGEPTPQPALALLDPGLLRPARRRALARLRRTSFKTPLVLLDAEGIHSGIAARRLGALGVLSKPVELTELKELVESLGQP
jgi:DNA-binding response OmpR family regulator